MASVLQRILALLGLCILCVWTEERVSCEFDSDCVGVSGKPYCGVIEPEKFASGGAVPAGYFNPSLDPAVSERSGTAATESSPGETPLCGRDEFPVSEERSYVGVQFAKRECVECTSDGHCGPGKWCVVVKTPKERPAGGYNTDWRAQLESDFSDPRYINLEGSIEVAHSFTHEKYSEDEIPVGTCVKKKWPLGETCSDMVTADNVDKSTTGSIENNLYCGLVTTWWSAKCRDGRQVGDPKLVPEEPAKMIQWEGACIDRKCCECTIGDFLFSGGEIFQCLTSSFSGRCGHFEKFEGPVSLSTSEIDRNASAQIKVVQLIFLIMIFGVVVVLVVTGKCGGNNDKPMKTAKPAKAAETKEDPPPPYEEKKETEMEPAGADANEPERFEMEEDPFAEEEKKGE